MGVSDLFAAAVKIFKTGSYVLCETRKMITYRRERNEHFDTGRLQLSHTHPARIKGVIRRDCKERGSRGKF